MNDCWKHGDTAINSLRKTLLHHGITLLVMLFGIRAFHALLNLRSEFGGMFRPQPITTEYAGIIMFSAALALLFLAGTKLKNLNESLQKHFLLFLACEYLLIGIFHNQVGQRSFICELIDNNLPFDELLSLYAMDYFFAPPYYFWGLLWLALSYRLAADRKHLLPIIWSPVILTLPLKNDAFPLIFALSTTLAAAVCSKLCRKQPATSIMWFWPLSQLCLLIWLNHNAALYRNSWLAVCFLFPFIWLPALLLHRRLACEKLPDAVAVTWLLPAFAGLTHIILLTHVPLAGNLFNMWYSLASLQFAAWVVVPVLAALLAAWLSATLYQRLATPVFMGCASMLILFYFIDSLVMFKTGLRLTYNTFDWMLGLSRITSLATTIGSTRAAWPLLAIITGLPALYFTVFKLTADNAASYRLKPFLLIACSTALVWQIFGIIPAGIYKDPLQMLLLSVQALALNGNDKFTYKELTEGFAACQIQKLTWAKATENPPGNSAKRNLVLIMLESTSNRYVSLFGHKDRTWPQLEGFKNRMEIFPFFFSCFPETSNADFTIMSGMYPPNFLLLRQKPDIPIKLLVDHCKAAGYDCSMYLSGFIGDTGKSAFYRSRGFDRMYDALNMPGAGREEGWTWGVKEHHVVSQVNEHVSRLANTPEKPFFIYYRMMYPHAPFQSVNGSTPVFNEEGHQRGNMVGRFKNCLIYQDGEIARLVKHLDSTGVASFTDVMIVADHGTMLGESGRLGHGWSLEPALTNVPMLIIRPEARGFKVNPTPGSQIDILPTALALTGLPQPEQGFCQGLNLLDNAGSTRAMLASRNIFLSSMSQTAVVENSLYYWFPDDESASPAVFRLVWKNDALTISQELGIASETVQQKKKQSISFQKLQKSLLLNMEFYQKTSAAPQKQ